VITELSHVDTWIFDLDNTLYPASSNLFPQVSRRMTDWVVQRFGLSFEAAREKQRNYYHKYGTTLRGLMLHDGVDPDDFLEYVHAIDLTDLPADQRLDGLIEALPGRKVIYTNGSRGHATRILAKLGIDRHFVEIFDIVAADFVPKPDPRPYDTMLERYAIDPARACMVEDMAHNLEPAKARGITTVWLQSAADADLPNGGRPGGAYVDYAIDDLAEWLHSLVGASNVASYTESRT
jgi:putative hydrolase of the HAD superfamily